MSVFILPPKSKSIGTSTKGGRKPQTLLAAARHNLREIQKEMGAGGHIDAARVHLNEILAGPDTASGVVALAAQMMEDIGYKPARKDYAQAHEMLFTLGKRTPVCAGDYFAWCLEFTRVRFGAGGILSAVIHRDEEEEHLHILIAPIASGAYLGSALITKPSWAELVDDYAAEALRVFGLKTLKKLDAKMRKQVTQAVRKGLRTALAGRIDADLMDALLRLAESKPAALLEPLGLTLGGLSEQAGDGGAEFRRIALSNGKGRKNEREQKPYGFADASEVIQKPYGFEVAEFGGNRKPYGFDIDQKTDSEPAIEKDRNHTCVVSREKGQPAHATQPPSQAPARMKATKTYTSGGAESWDARDTERTVERDFSQLDHDSDDFSLPPDDDCQPQPYQSGDDDFQEVTAW